MGKWWQKIRRMFGYEPSSGEVGTVRDHLEDWTPLKPAEADSGEGKTVVQMMFGRMVESDNGMYIYLPDVFSHWLPLPDHQKIISQRVMDKLRDEGLLSQKDRIDTEGES